MTFGLSAADVDAARTSEQNSTSARLGKDHGLIERRTLTSTSALNHHLDWPGVQQVCRVVRHRTACGRTTTETAYDITSRSRQKASAKQLAQTIRNHWGRIENGVHWVRDTAFDEDRCPHNWATVRNAALNFLLRLKASNLTAKLRSFTRNSQRLFAILGGVN